MKELLSLKCIDSISDYEFEEKENKGIKIVLCGENSNNIISNFRKIIDDAILRNQRNILIKNLQL